MNQLKQLKKDIEKHKNAKRAKPPSRATPASFALRAGSDFLGALITGGLLGYAADSYWMTKPWLMIGGLFLGLASGVHLLLKHAEKTSKK